MANKIRRYPGARPFSTDQKGIFFGRDQDIRELVELISIEQSVVLYSKSGLGKSSLINAGVIPKLKEEGALVPFSFRFGAFSSGSANSPLSTTIDRLASRQKSRLLDKILPGGDSLWYHLKSMQIADEHKKGYLLIFDQFEELFTYPKEQVNEFARQMAELLYTTIPVRYREVMEEKMKGKKKDPFLTDEEMKSLHQPFEIKVMMAIRSDRMSLLNQVTAYLPNILKTCYELKALNNDQAEDAILTPAYLKDERFITPVFDYTDEAIEKILDFLSKGNTQEIASFQLQILCESVERKVIEQGITLVKADDLGDIESLYKNYYDDQLAVISNPEEQLAARMLIEEGLIFEEEERRLTLYEGQIYKTFNISPELLRKLVDCHLLRSEPSTQGEGFNYEISHDSLVAPILRSKEKRRAREEELKRRESELQKLEEERKKVAIERKKRNRARMIAAVGFFLSLLAAVASLYAFNQAEKAKEAKEAALQAKNDAQEAEKKARQATFDVLTGQGIALQKEGRPEEAILKFEGAREYAATQTDSAKVDTLIGLSRQNASSSRLFEQFMTQADSAFVNEKFPIAFSYLNQAASNITTESNRSRVELKRKEFENELSKKVIDFINRAKNYKLITRCDLVKRELQKIENVRAFVPLSPAEAATLNDLKEGCQ